MSAPMHPLGQRLAGGLAGVDYNRFPTSVAAAATFKQWVHVAVIDPEIALVANFSAMPARTGSTAHRLTVLVYRGAGDGTGKGTSKWAGDGASVGTDIGPDDVRGHVRGFPADQCALPSGRTRLGFGGNELLSTGDLHELSLDEPALALRARLTMRAVARPAVLHHLPLGSRGGFHWAVVPRLVASGTVEYAGRRHVLVDAPAYRDRNWGSFCFGDVSWDWGYLTAPAGGPPCSLAYARLWDAARTRVIEQQLLVWWGGSLLASFRDREVSIAFAGAYDGPLATIPPALALCRPGRATGVPQTVTVTGGSSRGHVELRFTRAATARILVPNESRLGTTAIYESFGGAAVAGTVEGQDVAFAGLGFFECVHA